MKILCEFSWLINGPSKDRGLAPATVNPAVPVYSSLTRPKVTATASTQYMLTKAIMVR